MTDRTLVDSDAFIGWMVATDAHNQRATAEFDRLEQARIRLVTTNLVISETASMLSRRQSQEQAIGFLHACQTIETIYITDHFHQLTVQLFLEQARKRTSFVDLANVVVARHYGFERILSFDKVYAQDFNLSIAA